MFRVLVLRLWLFQLLVGSRVHFPLGALAVIGMCRTARFVIAMHSMHLLVAFPMHVRPGVIHALHG